LWFFFFIINMPNFKFREHCVQVQNHPQECKSKQIVTPFSDPNLLGSAFKYKNAAFSITPKCWWCGRNLYFVVIFRTAKVCCEKKGPCVHRRRRRSRSHRRARHWLLCDSINHENALVCPQVGHLPGCPGGRRTRCSTTPPSPSTTAASRMYCVWENWNADIYIPSTHARRLITIFQPPSPARYPSTSTVSTISFSFLCGGSLL
jgi:hypothetical protein